MRIKTIEAQNFRSFSHFKLELNDLGLTLLNGQNTGIDSERSNGAGKAQPYSEPIMTPMGIKNMGDLMLDKFEKISEISAKLKKTNTQSCDCPKI